MTEERPSRDLDKIIVRLPDGMRDQLAAAAKANKRSVNAEVVARLEVSLTASDWSPRDVETLTRLLQEAMNRLEQLSLTMGSPGAHFLGEQK